MIPTTYSHSLSSIMTPLHLNNEVHNHHHHHHHLFNPNHQPPSSSFSSPSSYPILYNPPNHDLQGSYCWELNHFPSDHQETGKIIPSSGSSWEHSEAENHESSIGSKVRVWNEDKGENLQEAEDDAEDGSMKWMPSKMRIMRKMMGLDETRGSYVASGSSMHKFEHERQPLLSPLGIDNSSKNNYPIQSTNSNTVRICSDCHTTKTPLWRSGPRGPKSLCNACGIRQRKARRAMAAAAANGRVVMAAEKSVKGKEKKSKTEFASPKMKKKQKIIISKPSSQTTNKFSFEDLTLRLSKNVAFKQVFPQDEKEAAILLMALSYGFVHR